MRSVKLLQEEVRMCAALHMAEMAVVVVTEMVITMMKGMVMVTGMVMIMVMMM